MRLLVLSSANLEQPRSYFPHIDLNFVNSTRLSAVHLIISS
jgi:hypothetical protein